MTAASAWAASGTSPSSSSGAAPRSRYARHAKFAPRAQSRYFAALDWTPRLRPGRVSLRCSENAQTSATRYNIETWNMILNLDGLSWSQMQLDALKAAPADYANSVIVYTAGECTTHVP